MIDKHDQQTFDWVQDMSDNSQTLNETASNQTKLNQTEKSDNLSEKENVMSYETQTQLDEVVVPSIATSAMVVSLSRSVPDLVKNDPEAARALARIKHADPKRVTSRKKLIDSPQHNALQKLSRTIYRWHMDNTLPWGNLGARLVSNAKLLDYQAQMEDFANEFYQLKAEFLDDYPRAASAAQMELGDLFDQSLFPSVYALDCRIAIHIDYEPLVDPDNWIVQVGNQAAHAMKSQYEDMLKRRVESAYSDVFKRLREPLENMSKMLNYSGDDKPTGFHDTLVSNVAKFVELMRNCNVTNDATMTGITNNLRMALDGITPDALRNSETQRLQTKQDIDKIIQQMPTLDF